MNIALISDTHGNLTAFQTVLADIDRRGADRIVHLGDLAGKGPRGADCCALASARCETVIRGNWDEFIVREPGRRSSAAMLWWRHELGADNRGWLSALPFSVDFALAGTAIRCFHASSDSVFHRIYPNMDDDMYAAQFANTAATCDGPEPQIVVYADIHHAYERIEGKRALLNTGSVGNPMDIPVSSYIMLSDDTGEAAWEIIRVPYDIEGELAVARDMHMPDYDAWAQELRTAIYAR